MKKRLSLFCLLLLTTHLVHAQHIDSTRRDIRLQYDQNMRSHKIYKTTGRVVLGAGIAMMIIGGIGFGRYTADGYNGPAPATSEALLFIARPAAALTSIPLFVLARKRKRKTDNGIERRACFFGEADVQLRLFGSWRETSIGKVAFQRGS